MSYTKGYRYIKVPGTNNKYAVPKKEIQNPAYAATIALSIDAEQTVVDHAQLTGDLTETVGVALPYTGDTLRLLYATDGTSRTVTFSTGFIVSVATLVIADTSQAIVDFVFCGSVQLWVETNRTAFV